MLPLLLGGCFYNQTDIQGDYEAVRKGCQALAESKIAAYDTPERAVSEKDRNAELVTLFSDCMAKSGWQVATPKRAGETVVKPKKKKSAQTAAPVQQAPVKDGAVQTQATPLTPSASMPPLRQPVNPNAATYQPAPNQSVTPYYGSGPGRSF
jgi:hypothetical protein